MVPTRIGLVAMLAVLTAGVAGAHSMPYPVPVFDYDIVVESDHLSPSATVQVVDSALSPVGFEICQDLDQDGLCGEPGEPMAEYCSSGFAGVYQFGFDVHIIVEHLPFGAISECGFGSEGQIIHS